jgi:hypothetical protein
MLTSVADMVDGIIAGARRGVCDVRRPPRDPFENQIKGIEEDQS